MDKSEKWIPQNNELPGYRLARYSPFFDVCFLGGGNSNICYFHPYPWGNDPI